MASCNESRSTSRGQGGYQPHHRNGSRPANNERNYDRTVQSNNHSRGGQSFNAQRFRPANNNRNTTESKLEPRNVDQCGLSYNRKYANNGMHGWRGHGRGGSFANQRGGKTGQHHTSDKPLIPVMPKPIVQRKRQEPTNELATCPTNAQNLKKGSTGQQVILQSNYFKLKNKTDWCLYQYRVDISPEEERTAVHKAFLRQHKAILGVYVFDGSILYTSNLLRQPLELHSKRPGDEQAVNIKIRLVGDLMKGDYHYLQFFNLLVRKGLEHLNLQLVGRNYFDALSRVEVREYQLELWPGYVTSIRQHDSGVLMCAEISHKVMRNQTVLSILQDCFQQNQHNYQLMFSNTVMGCIVLTDYNNRTYKVDDVDFEMNLSKTFKMRDGTDMSYAAYYKQKYQITIRDLGQPLLVSRSTARKRRAGEPELIYLIPELCRSTGFTDEMRCNFHLMKAVSEFTRIGPAARIDRLMQLKQRLTSTTEVIKEFKEWSFELDNDLVQVPARILPVEKVYFGDKKFIRSRNSDWNFNLQDNSAIRCTSINDWVVVVPSRAVDNAKKFIDVMLNAASKMKMPVRRPRLQVIPDDRIDNYVHTLTEITDHENPQFILCVTTNNKLDRYAAIKKTLCVNRAIPSQVVLARTLQQKSASMLHAVCSKVLVQMNCKLGGIPWQVELGSLLPGLMVVGFDVCHSKTAGGDYGGMVASLDPNFSRYFSAVSEHASGEELSNDLSLHLGQAVEKFWIVNNNKLPSRIIIFRDGVGEGQIPFVHDFEVKQIKKRLSAIYGGDDKFRLAFIIVTKRINSRFFMNGQNPTSGTVVDDVVTDPLKYDYFIVSQNVRQGTVTPTAYNVIDDNTDLTCDQMQILTFKLCHMYFNFTGTVRVPAPCQYAHKLAYFTSQALQQPVNPGLQTTLYFL